MLRSKIKAIPREIKAKIKAIDEKHWNFGTHHTRWYAYIDTNAGELVKVTCAVRGGDKKKWEIMQTAIHGVDTEKKCFVNNMKFTYVGGYHAEWGCPTEWWEAEGNFFDVDVYSIVNCEKVFEYEQYKYCAYDFNITHDVIKYLRMYREYPEIEYLVKANLSMYWDSKMLLNALRKDKNFRKYIMENNVEKPIVMMNAYKNGISIEEARAEEHFRRQGYAVLAKTYKGECLKMMKYVSEKHIGYATLKDYVNACNALGIDMTDTKNRYPNDFQHWHGVRIDEYATAKAMKDAEERKEFYAQFAAVAEKYLSMQESKDGYAIVIARSPAELIKEGEALHHCVGQMGYDQKVVRGESLIFFVRKAENIEDPFVTMEYNLKRNDIAQIHAKNNTAPSQEVKNFVFGKWLPRAKKKLRKIA